VPDSSKIILAVDKPSLCEAQKIIESVGTQLQFIKLGLEFFLAEGKAGVRKIKETYRAKIFLDLKLHDIPNTVGKAISSLSDVDVDIITVHLQGGRAMLEAAKKAASPNTMIAGVSVLTSLSQADLLVNLDSYVEYLVKLGQDSGIDACVCSPFEIKLVKTAAPKLKIITPGIRAETDNKGDQNRTMSAAQAFFAGSDYIVVGRPITESTNPKLAFAELINA
jgi:orotidine-5'-phosphate decarboxylase